MTELQRETTAISRETPSRGSLAVLLGGLLGFYAFAVIGGPYLYADDYYIRQLVVRGDLDWWNNLFTQMGRPLFGLFNRIVFDLGSDLAVYGGVRAVGLFGTLVCALRLHQMGMRRGWNPWLLTALGFLVFANPGWAVFVGWTMCAAFPWAGWLALEAGNLALRPTDEGKSRRTLILAWMAAAALWRARGLSVDEVDC